MSGANKNYLRKIVSKEVDNFFNTVPSYISDEKLLQLRDDAKDIEVPYRYGSIISFDHFMKTVDLVYDSSQEKAHRDLVLNTTILSNIKCENWLDIGVGNGDLTKMIAPYCNKYVGIDIDTEAFKSLPKNLGKNNNPITTITGSMLSEETWAQLPKVYFDLILLGHVIYYSPPEERNALVAKAYDKLSQNGKLVIIFNEGGGRGELAEKFEGKNGEFNIFIEHVLTSYPSQVYESAETVRAKDLSTMLHIAGLMLYDTRAVAGQRALSDYIAKNHYKAEDGLYEITMFQKIVIIGDHNNDFDNGY